MIDLFNSPATSNKSLYAQELNLKYTQINSDTIHIHRFLDLKANTNIKDVFGCGQVFMRIDLGQKKSKCSIKG